MYDRKGGTRQIAAPLDKPARNLDRQSASRHQGRLHCNMEISRTHRPRAKTIQLGANVIAIAPATLNHPVQVIPPLTP